MSSTWDQSVFDETIKQTLMAHESTVWPKCLNKQAFFIVHQAIKETPAVEIGTVLTGLLRPIVPSTSKSGQSVPVGFVIAAKHAKNHWRGGTSLSKAKQFSRLQQGKSANMLKAWRKEVDAALERMLGSRARALAFIRLGWIFTKMDLAKVTGLSVWSGNPSEMAKAKGRMKGGASVATASSLSVTIENSAHAQSETRGGFEAHGQPALDRAMEWGNANMREHLESEMEPGIQDFNSKQGR